MSTQTLRTSTLFSCSFITLPSEEPIFASSLDYGFDIDEHEIAAELMAPVVPHAVTEPAHADEYCSLHFLS